MLPRQVRPIPGKRIAAVCLILVTLVLLAIPDEADLQPVMVGGLQSFIDDVDDADDGGTGVSYPVVAAADSAVHNGGMFAQGDVSEDAMCGRRIRQIEGASPRGPPARQYVKLEPPPVFLVSLYESPFLTPDCLLRPDVPQRSRARMVPSGSLASLHGLPLVDYGIDQ